MTKTPPKKQQLNTTKRAKPNSGGPKSDKPKEKLFHPLSRKAGQLERENLRKRKLATAATKRTRSQVDKNERFLFFRYALPPGVESLTLPAVHDIIRDCWLPRHDLALEKERAERRKGRPPSVKEDKIMALQQQEAEEYRTGLEIPDLTHEPTVALLRKWDDGDPSNYHLFRLVRVSSSEPDHIVLASKGIKEFMEEADGEAMEITVDS